MEKLERDAYKGDDQSALMYMSSFERRYLSKWNHADVLALVEAGQRLLNAGADVRDKVVVDDTADFMAYRACIFALAILHSIKALYGVSIAELDGFTDEVNALKSRFDAQAEGERRTAEENAARYRAAKESGQR